MKIPMLARFCAYGFLKNQRYFEPFFVLALLEKELNFFQIGILFSFRELMINLAEIPSGSIADIYGRRRSMVFSFISYILSFLIFATTTQYHTLFAAMLFYATGDAFRTGTHKAMIFSWLRLQGKEAQRLSYYGFTRSWSKIGSALSALFSGIFVYYFKEYTSIFYISCIPYIFNIVNVISYPPELDGEKPQNITIKNIYVHTKNVLFETLKSSYLRHLVLESMGFVGVFNTMKEYLQPVLQALAVGILLHLSFAQQLTDEQKSVLLVVPVYSLLFLTSAVISRNAYKIISIFGDEDVAAMKSWILYAVFSLLVILAGLTQRLWLVALAFILIYNLQNLWRPFLISRFDSYSREEQGATILSIESQSRRIVTMILAPLLGYGVDAIKNAQLHTEYALVGSLGLLSSLFFLYINAKRQKQKIIIN